MKNMDYKTKAYYRNKIKEISKRTKISRNLYYQKKALELAKKHTIQYQTARHQTTI